MIRLKTYRRIFGISIPRRVTLPSGWAEVSRRQAIMFARSLMLHNAPFGNYSAPFKFGVINAFTGLDPRLFYTMSDVAIALLIHKMQAFWEGDSSYPALRYIRIRFTRYYLPEWCMDSSTFLQLAWAEEFYLKLIEGEEVEKNLHLLAGVLCQPRGRQVKHELVAERLAAHAPEAAQLFAVYFYYYSVRQQLRTMYPAVYQEKSNTAGTGGPDFTSRYHLVGVIHSLAADGPFGTWDQAAATNCHKVLHFMNYNADKMREMELKRKLDSVSL